MLTEDFLKLHSNGYGNLGRQVRPSTCSTSSGTNSQTKDSHMSRPDQKFSLTATEVLLSSESKHSADSGSSPCLDGCIPTSRISSSRNFLVPKLRVDNHTIFKKQKSVAMVGDPDFDILSTHSFPNLDSGSDMSIDENDIGRNHARLWDYWHFSPGQADAASEAGSELGTFADRSDSVVRLNSDHGPGAEQQDTRQSILRLRLSPLHQVTYGNKSLRLGSRLVSRSSGENLIG